MIRRDRPRPRFADQRSGVDAYLIAVVRVVTIGIRIRNTRTELPLDHIDQPGLVEITIPAFRLQRVEPFGVHLDADR